MTATADSCELRTTARVDSATPTVTQGFHGYPLDCGRYDDDDSMYLERDVLRVRRRRLPRATMAMTATMTSTATMTTPATMTRSCPTASRATPRADAGGDGAGSCYRSTTTRGLQHPRPCYVCDTNCDDLCPTASPIDWLCRRRLLRDRRSAAPTRRSASSSSMRSAVAPGDPTAPNPHAHGDADGGAPFPRPRRCPTPAPIPRPTAEPTAPTTPPSPAPTAMPIPMPTPKPTPVPSPVPTVVGCTNGVLDTAHGETDIDCGGAYCPACGVGAACSVADDCGSGWCVGATCAAAPTTCRRPRRRRLAIAAAVDAADARADDAIADDAADARADGQARPSCRSVSA